MKLNLYEVTVNWSGYSEGYKVLEVQAASEEEAKDLWKEGEPRSIEVTADDTVEEVTEVQLIQEGI